MTGSSTVMEATRELDLHGITITSPVVRLITYSLMDAYRIIVVHEQNHFVQARRAMKLLASPGTLRSQVPLGRSGRSDDSAKYVRGDEAALPERFTAVLHAHS